MNEIDKIKDELITDEEAKKTEVPAVATPNAIAAIEYAEQRISHMSKFISLALKVTNAKDWIDIEGTPYLQISGAQKVGRLFGFGVKNVTYVKSDKIDQAGKHYIYTYKGFFYLSGHETEGIEAIGTCSSRDKFFGTTGGAYKELENVDETNIQKKAYTNMLNRGIKSLLGINGLTWEMINEIKGISGTTKVTYQAGKKGGESSEDIKTKISKMCAYLANGDSNEANKIYHKHGDFSTRDGRKVIAPEISNLSDKYARSIYGKLKAEFDQNGISLNMVFDRLNGDKKEDNNVNDNNDNTGELPF